MECIQINVPLDIAKKWKEVDPKVKLQIEKSFGRQIDSIVNKSAEADFDQLLIEIRKEAKENGLTPEILEQILNEE